MKIKKSLAQKSIEKAQEERINEVLKSVKGILPLLQGKEKTINQTKIQCDTIAVVLNQSLYGLMRKTLVKDLELAAKLKLEVGKEKDEWEAILSIIENENLETATEAMQWISSKIDALLKAETAKRPFDELNIDLDCIK